jgi:hypothetical protein
MNPNVGKWEKVEFADVENFGDLFQNLSIFRYSHYLEEISKILKYGEIERDLEGKKIIFEKSGRRICYYFICKDETKTEPVFSSLIPLIRFNNETKNALVLFMASAEVNARMNFPRNAAEFTPLEMPEVFFSN